LADYFPKYGKGQGQGQGNAPQQSLIPPNAFKLPTPEQNANLKNISELAANKGLTTAATERQLEGAIQVSGIMNNPEFQNKAIAASEYAGALGKGKSAVDALSQKNPQAYENYISFVNHDMVLLENRIKTLDQMGATDSQREQLQNLYKKTMDSITSNPKQFITQFNMLGESLDRVAQSVGVSASPASNAPLKRLQKYNPIPEPGQQSAPGTKVINGQQFQNINGKWYQK
jgi:hypothetical protein